MKAPDQIKAQESASSGTSQTALRSIVDAIAPTPWRSTEDRLIALGLHPSEASVLLRHMRHPGLADEVQLWIERGLTPTEAGVHVRHRHGGPGNVLVHDEDGTYAWLYAPTERLGDDGDADSEDLVVPATAVERAAIESLMRKGVLEPCEGGFFIDVTDDSEELA